MKPLIEFCLTRRVMVIALFFAFCGIGGLAFTKLNIEAYPNPAPPILEIIAQNRGQSPEEMERYITIPIEVGIASTPNLKFVRSISLYGLSFVRAQFSYGTDYNFAYQQVVNKLNAITLPNNVQPQISGSSPTGEIYRYQLVGPPGMSATELRTLQDWVVTRRIKTVAGVRDVVSWGGPTKEYQVEVDLNRLPAYNITLAQVIAAIANSNINVGGRTLQIGQQSANIRGIGLIYSVEDINNIVLTQSNGTPVLVSDLAKVSIGQAPRLGIAGRDADADVVTGIVLMQQDEKTVEVIQRLEAEVVKLNSGGMLPAGVQLKSYYNRANLVSITVNTVVHNLLFGIVLLFFIQWLFLGNLRSAIIVAATIPVALSFSTIILVLRGESVNLLSVGAIDIGIIVDGTVIMVENIYHNLQSGSTSAWASIRDSVTQNRSLSAKMRTVLASALQVNTAILFSVLITIAAFIPLFTMQGVEGQIFSPMSKTYAFALLGALLSSILIIPALSSILLPDDVRDTQTWLVRMLQSVYVPALGFVMSHRKLAIAAAAGLLLATGVASRFLGSEFLPKLEEGNLWIRATLPPTISLEAGAATVNRVREILKSFPEVVTAISQHGRPDDGTDPAGFNNAEFFAPLKPHRTWRPGMTKEKLVKDMETRFAAEFLGIDFNFSQIIQDNVEEAVSGVKGENSVKLFGNDLKTLEVKALQIEAQMKPVRGIDDLGIFRELGQPNLVITIDRAQAARYGFAAGDVNAVVQAAIGGQVATTVYEGERTFNLTVRLLPQYRDSLDAIRSIQVAATQAGGASGPASGGGGNPVLQSQTATPTTLPVSSGTPGGGSGQQTGAYVPLSDLAHIAYEIGASYIYRENYQRYIPIKFSVRGRDLASTVAEAQEKVTDNVKLADGYTLDWAGEFGSLQAAQKRLAVIVPASLALIMLILYGMFNSLRMSLLAVAAIPFAMCGGVLALLLTGLNFSISAAVGFISLFGVSVMDSIMLLTFYKQLRTFGQTRDEALTTAGEARMRQIMTTSFSACIGLLPAAMSSDIGSQVQAPLATVVVGGMLLSPVLTLLFLPVIGTMLLPKDADDDRPDENSGGGGDQNSGKHV